MVNLLSDNKIGEKSDTISSNQKLLNNKKENLRKESAQKIKDNQTLFPNGTIATLENRSFQMEVKVMLLV